MRRSYIVPLLLCTAAAADDKPARTEIARAGKAAAALILTDTATGTGFCVHPTGLFVTNDHVVKKLSPGKELKVVLDAGMKTQRVLAAKTVRSDAALDLALIRVEGAGDLPTLKLGASDTVTELAEVIAFGFPFGDALSSNRDMYPAVSVNVCTVSSLRQKDGRLDRIDLNGAVNPGQSGGPLLDANGKVVGVVVSGIRGSGIFQGIPSAVVARFLAKPDLEFKPPVVVDAAAATKPATFRVRVAAPIEPEAPYDVEMTLTGQGPDRRVKLEPRDGGFEAAVIPLPPATGPKLLDLTARFAGGTVIHSAVADREVSVAGKPVPLREIARIVPGETAQVLRTDATALSGRVGGLESVEVTIGGRAVALDLGTAESVQIELPGGADDLKVTVVVSVAGKEVGRTGGTVALGGPVRKVGPVLGRTMPAAPVGAETVVRKLPGPFSDVVLGGNGKYLIFALAKERKLAVFDVSAARIAGFIPVDDDAKFAAGMDKLVVLLPSKNVLQRWDLATRERDLVVPAPAGKVSRIALGHASAGPVLVVVDDPSVGRGGKPEFLALKSLATLTLREGSTDRTGGFFGLDANSNVRASADGQTFAHWRTSGSPSGVSTLLIRGESVHRHYTHASAGALLPAPDGRVIYSAFGRYSDDCKPLDGTGRDGGYAGGPFGPNATLPAAHGPFYLTVKDGGKKGLDVHLAGAKRPIGQLDLRDDVLAQDAFHRDALGVDQRVVLVPEAKVLVTLPRSNDEVVLSRFDLDDLLEKSGTDYLLVTSTPPAAARRGAPFHYQIVARAKKGGLTYRLESGPAGLAVGPDGAVTWAVPADPAAADAGVIVTVRDAAGQEAFHSFTLKLE